jgi:predicted  nucleic acid-binding Zn-ribbon protein
MSNELIALVRLHEMEFGIDNDPMITRERTEVEMRRCRTEINPGLLARYEQLKKRHASTALVEVENGTCSGCRVMLPKSSANGLKHGPVSCDHCGRILFDPDSVYNFQY